MNLSTITMERDQAKEAFQQYHEAVKERRSAEDEAIMRAYKFLAGGEDRQLLRLSDVMVRGGTVRKMVGLGTNEREIDFPALAVARADQRWCWSGGITDTGAVEMISKPPREIAPNNWWNRVRLPADTFDPSNGRTWGWGSFLRAMVPIIPPPLRPRDKLGSYHVLWEADWQRSPEPPGDPALLKRLGGELYAVVAVWDLTEVERAVLAGRMVEAA